MIKILIFSKDRPMQLQALLDSMHFYTNVIDYEIAIIYKGSTEYDSIKKRYSHNNLWIEEDINGGFHKCLRFYISTLKDDDIVLFSVDDFVYFRPFNIEMLYYLGCDPGNIGISLRLGSNIENFNTLQNTRPQGPFAHIKWQGAPSHFGYPFDLSHSAYRVDFIKDIIDSAKDPFRLPNDFEAHGYNRCYSAWTDKKPYYLMSNGPSFGACADCNRVQDVYQNRVQGTVETSAQSLLKKYNDGYVINWNKYAYMQPVDCFIGTENMEFVKIEKV